MDSELIILSSYYIKLWQMVFITDVVSFSMLILAVQITPSCLLAESEALAGSLSSLRCNQFFCLGKRQFKRVGGGANASYRSC